METCQNIWKRVRDLMGGSLLIGQRRHLSKSRNIRLNIPQSMCYHALRCTIFLVNLSHLTEEIM